jgi:hypothetical protein
MFLGKRRIIMTRKEQERIGDSATSLAAAALRLMIVFVLMVVASQAAQAQSFQVIHSFTGGVDGANPNAGLMMDNDGTIWRYTGTPSSGSSCPGWQLLDNNPQAAAIAGGDQLFQLHKDGSIWRYTGTPCTGSSCPGWESLDNNPTTKAVSASYVQ